MSTTQTPLPGPEAALIGLAALVVVMMQILWPLAEHFNAMAHEGSHAMTGSILSFPVQGVELGSALGLMSVMMLQGPASPGITRGVTTLQLSGYIGLFLGVTLILRVVIGILRPRR